MAFESPLKPQRSVVALYADQSGDLSKISQALTSPDQFSIQGDLAVVDEKSADYAKVAPTYYLGALPQMSKLRWFSRTNPCWPPYYLCHFVCCLRSCRTAWCADWLASHPRSSRLTGQAMKTIAFVSAKGGVGKTTLTANLVAVLAARGLKVLVIDLDPQNALCIHLGLDPQEHAGLVRRESPCKACSTARLESSSFHSDECTQTNWQSLKRTQDAPRWLFESIRSIPRNRFDYILIDTPPGPSAFLQQSLAAVHMAIIVVLADAASYVTIPHILGLTKTYTKSSRRFKGAHIVLNQLPHKVNSVIRFRQTCLPSTDRAWCR